MASAIAALILTRNSTLTWTQVRSLMRGSCDHIGGVTYTGGENNWGWNDHYGYGRLNAQTAVNNTTADATVPIVTAVQLRTGRAIEVTFSEPMDESAVAVGNYTISGSACGTMSANPAFVSRVTHGVYRLGWIAGEMVAGTANLTLTVSSSVKDVASHPLASSYNATLNGASVIYAVNCG